MPFCLLWIFIIQIYWWIERTTPISDIYIIYIYIHTYIYGVYYLLTMINIRASACDHIYSFMGVVIAAHPSAPLKSLRMSNCIPHTCYLCASIYTCAKVMQIWLISVSESESWWKMSRHRLLVPQRMPLLSPLAANLINVAAKITENIHVYHIYIYSFIYTYTYTYCVTIICSINDLFFFYSMWCANAAAV